MPRLIKLHIFIILLFFTILGKAQNPVFVLGDNINVKPENCYVKDSNNILNKFNGTWVFSNGTSQFKVVLTKVEMSYFVDHYRDEIFGWYERIVNGETIINTQDYTARNSRLKTTFLGPNENVILLAFYDPERPRMGAKARLTYSNVNGIEKLLWELINTGNAPQMPDQPITEIGFRVPITCELSKQ